MPLQRISGIWRSWRVVVGIAGMAFISQAINFGFSLVIPRLYTDISFGELGLYLAVVLVLAEMINLRLDIALNTVKDREDAFGICRAAISTGIIVALLSGLVCSIVKYVFPGIVLHPLAITVALVLYAIHQPTFWMLNREGRFAAISAFRVMQVIITGIVTVAIAFLSATMQGLIIGFCSGLAVSALGQGWLIYRAGGKAFSRHTPLRATIHRFRQFWVYGTWSALFNNLSRQLPVYFLQWGYGLAPAGQYTMGTRLLNAPVWTISGALGQYFVKQAIHMNNQELLRWVRKTLVAGFLISIFPSIVLFMCGETIFSWLFGAQWAEAGKMVQWLIFWYMTFFTIGPITQVLDLRGKLRFEFWYNSCLMLSRAASLAIGWHLGSYKAGLLLFAATGVIFNIWQWLYIENILRIPNGNKVDTAG